MDSDSVFVGFLVGVFFALIFLWAFDDKIGGHKVTSGKLFIYEDASYRCKMINKLEEE